MKENGRRRERSAIVMKDGVFTENGVRKTVVNVERSKVRYRPGCGTNPSGLAGNNLRKNWLYLYLVSVCCRSERYGNIYLLDIPGTEACVRSRTFSGSGTGVSRTAMKNKFCANDKLTS